MKPSAVPIVRKPTSPRGHSLFSDVERSCGTRVHYEQREQKEGSPEIHYLVQMTVYESPKAPDTVHFTLRPTRVSDGVRVHLAPMSISGIEPQRPDDKLIVASHTLMARSGFYPHPEKGPSREDHSVTLHYIPRKGD